MTRMNTIKCLKRNDYKLFFKKIKLKFLIAQSIPQRKKFTVFILIY